MFLSWNLFFGSASLKSASWDILKKFFLYLHKLNGFFNTCVEMELKKDKFAFFSITQL